MTSVAVPSRPANGSVERVTRSRATSKRGHSEVQVLQELSTIGNAQKEKVLPDKVVLTHLQTMLTPSTQVLM